MSVVFIEGVLKVSGVIAAAATANVLCRRLSAASRHLIWTLAVASLLALPIFWVVLPGWRIAIPVAASIGSDVTPDIEPVGRTDVSGSSAAAEDAVTFSATAAPAGIRQTTPIGGRMWVSLAAVLFICYVAGVGVLLLRLAYERWAVRRLARRAIDVTDPAWRGLLLGCAAQIGVQRPVRLLRSLDRSMPMAFGVRLPAILIPSVADTWPDDRRRAVLLHELAHIARHDCLTQFMAAVSCALYWIHPGVWWIARRLRVERELACDDLVLKAGTHAREYAEHLLELAYTMGSYRAPALVVSMARARHVEGRMLAVLDVARNRTSPAVGSRLAGVVIATALLLPLSTAQATIVSASAVSGQKDTKNMAEAAGVTEKGLPGTWEIRATQAAQVVRLRLSESAGSSHSSTIPVDRLQGLAPSLLSGPGGVAKFVIRRDAGTFAFEGMFKSGVGAGTYSFAPSAGFPDQFVKRGLARPTAADQYVLARADIGFAFLDELTAQRYARPDLPQLVRAGEHGVDLVFVREMAALGYRLGQLDALIGQRDHGVSPQFIRELSAQGLTGLTAEDLVRARDHGVSPRYIGELKTLGYASLSLDSLVGARDHGVSPEYVRDLRQLGYQLTLADLTRARDHGVSPEYVRDLVALGYPHMSLDSLIGARDHGISPEYVRELQALGYRLTIEELTRARDHGVSAEYVRALKAQGREGLTLDELVAMRDRGVGPHDVDKQLVSVSLFEMVKNFHDHVFRVVHRWTH
jgi:beta-lactamase regulating signal transducer with metallopeptidase domain